MKRQRMNENFIDGILLFNKAKGLTSNSALQKVKRIFSAKKAGHTGSLDPDATGMLPICFGEATKLSHYLLDRDKTYTATGVLGVKTSTADASGEIIAEVKTVDLSIETLQSVLESFKGELQQIPPMYSALKSEGRPLYRLARAGITIDRAPRTVQIYALELIDFSPPYFTIKTDCSKGTYIRTLVEDIGEALGVHAHVLTLHRNYTAGFKNERSYSLEELTAASMEERLSYLLPMERIAAAFLRVDLSLAQEQKLILGQAVKISQEFPVDSVLALYNSEAKFMALGEINAEGLLKVKRLLIQK